MTHAQLTTISGVCTMFSGTIFSCMMLSACSISTATAAVASPSPSVYIDPEIPLELTLLIPWDGGNACLDGSPFGYYTATNENSSDWVIDIAGGGWCTTAAECLERIQTSNRLASSTTWSPTISGSGITSGSSTDNPEFSSYNRVFMPYCDGSSFTSHRDTALPVTAPNGTVVELHMRGANNMAAAVASLQRIHGMVGVRHLVVTGGSAGGLSTFLHTDLLGRLVGAKTVVGMPDAGAFRVVTPGCCAWADIVQLHNSTGALNQQCVEAQNKVRPTENSSGWRCFTAPTLLNGGFVQAPLFVLQSQFDHFQLSAMASIPCAIAQAYFPPWKTTPQAVCTATDNASIAAYGAGWKRDFAMLLGGSARFGTVSPTKSSVSGSKGLFMTACMAHEERGTAGWTTLTAGGVVLRDAFYAFHNAVTAPTQRDEAPRLLYLDDYPLPTNLNRQVCAPLTPNTTE